MRVLVRFVLVGLFAIQCDYTGLTQPKVSLVPRVDQRVELLSIVFRLAGNDEYNMSELKKYTDDIDDYFADYRNHPAVVMARKLAQKNHVGFDAVMGMAIHLSDPPSLKPLVPFTDKIPDARWGRDNAAQFLKLLQDFYRETRFERFFIAHQSLYQLAESRFQIVLDSLNLDWYGRFYGEKPKGQFRLILGLNNGGGNYGPRIVFPDGREELYAIMGCWTKEENGDPTYTLNGGYLSTIIHEFNHSFINPLVDRQWRDFGPAEIVYKSVAKQLQAQAYGSAKTMVDESLVRAAVILYFEAQGEDEKSLVRRVRKEQALGFVWMDELCTLLRNYESGQGRYRTLAAYMNDVSRFYDALSRQIGDRIVQFRKNCVHVTGMQPFPNHASEIDPDLQDMTITFDKELDPSGFSFNFGTQGKDHFPLQGKPQFLPGNQSIKLHLALKPHWSYSLVLTPAGFVSPDGYPLEMYSIDFKTK